MLKINMPILDTALSIGQPTILVVEDTSLYAAIIRNFYQYPENNDLKIFDEKNKALSGNELMLVTDILGYDINSPTLLKLVHAGIEHQLNEKPEVKSMIEKLASTITDLIAFECLENELDLEYDEITILELIKALGVQIETRSDTIFEKCFEILQIYNYLQKKRILVFFNIGAYLTRTELVKLLEYISLSNQTVLFLEPKKLYDFPQYILDQDYFLTVEHMV
ncbi:type II-A CRISPR-associated protein Csn2 [Streptococcus sp. zg-86]|uniref:Type II-A CRISPR-associated protein Csn2 n=1 Tax=Streptococcus zhangguiae TaxID=2664091 RepID=A0A6I4RH93_9STRE|nr:MULTISPECIES: type II-A CRISPR-associated protein Csn2 [unclassified Streptococcus]MTB64210.1 type II-A CRISPR-associated protein Csn2 [Streptococcus sp. zg-86]MTB90464.1 type II-A CRISPR-associated protein Csn2 [Streptococcus sp. zg-36]MWV56197.1 type II-A CRISPR-associated protein Csn2 [Streptococcus sp. zg-70]QTH48181.1 type II-A CRISPR-associated protein Csn2 [Streptococcus sp. zg-86]